MENQLQTRINIQIYGTNAGFPAQMEEKMSGWCEEGVKWGTHGALIEIFWRWGCRNWEKMDEIQHRWMENQFKIDTLIYGWSTGERMKRWMIEGGKREVNGHETLIDLRHFGTNTGFSSVNGRKDEWLVWKNLDGGMQKLVDETNGRNNGRDGTAILDQ